MRLPPLLDVPDIRAADRERRAGWRRCGARALPWVLGALCGAWLTWALGW